MPNSSAVTAKMKSVWRVGQDALDRAFARAACRTSRRHESSASAISTWKVSRCRRGAGIEESIDARRAHAARFIGEHQPPMPAAADADDPEPVQPGHEEQRAQTSETSMVWPKSGCRISSDDVDGSSSSAMRLAGMSGACRLRRKPGDEDDEGGLEEFRRLDAEESSAARP